ncbi:class II glutamine amidotransferase [Agathobaculum sp.]
MKIHIPHGVNVVMGHTRMTTQGNAQFNQNNHPFLGHVDGNSFALAHNGVLWNDKELRMEENLPLTSVETDSYVAVQLLEQQKTLDFDSLKAMAEKVEGSFVFTVLDKDNSIWFVVGDNPLCIMYYDGFLLYASTQEILCKAIKKLRLKAPTDILEPKEGEILKIDRIGRITYGAFTPKSSFEHWWRKYPYFRDYCEDTPESYDDLFSVAKAFGVSADEVQALLDYGCSEEEIEEMLYDPALLHEMTGELLYAY